MSGFPPALVITQTNSAQISGTAPGYPRERQLLSLSITTASLKAWISALNSSKTPFPPTLFFVTHVCFTTKCGRSASALPVHLNAPPAVVSAAHKINASSTKGNADTTKPILTLTYRPLPDYHMQHDHPKILPHSLYDLNGHPEKEKTPSS